MSIPEIAKKLVDTAKASSTYGNWIYSFNELEKDYKVNADDITALVQVLQASPDVLEVDVVQDDYGNALSLYLAGDFESM